MKDCRMRERAETVVAPIPDDCTLLPIVSVAACLGCSERSARNILAEHGAPIIAVGARSHSARLSDVRRVIKARERSATKHRAKGCSAPQPGVGVFGHGPDDEQAA
jgi:hypothetical protein